MSKTSVNEKLRLLGLYERTCGEIPPADLLDAESSRQFIRQLAHRYGNQKKLPDGKKGKRY
ncbi:MAG: hypothetical protein HQM06_05450 [Magnetococcales bacterium]|nr:hypothetical protein [Magnetococcales bacterium]